MRLRNTCMYIVKPVVQTNKARNVLKYKVKCVLDWGFDKLVEWIEFLVLWEIETPSHRLLLLHILMVRLTCSFFSLSFRVEFVFKRFSLQSKSDFVSGLLSPQCPKGEEFLPRDVWNGTSWIKFIFGRSIPSCDAGLASSPILSSFDPLFKPSPRKIYINTRL